MILDNYKDIVGEIKKYLTLQVDYAKYTIVEKMIILFSAMAMALILGALGFGVLFYLSISLSSLLASAIGSEWGAHLIVAGLYAVLLVLVVVNKRRWIENPIALFITKLFLKPNDK